MCGVGRARWRGGGMSEAEYIIDAVKSACDLAEILKAKGDLKGAREILDGVA